MTAPQPVRATALNNNQEETPMSTAETAVNTDFAIQPFTAFEPDKAGAWTGVPMEEYHRLPGESNSLLSLLARSPRRYRLSRDGLTGNAESTHDQELGVMIH